MDYSKWDFIPGLRSSCFLLILMAVLVAGPPSAGAEPQVGDIRESRSWSLGFGITDEFTLKTFGEGFFSVTKHLSRRTSLRLGLAGDGFKIEQDDAADPTDISIGVSATYLKYPDVSKRAAFYFGAGPTFDYDRSKKYLSGGATSDVELRYDIAAGLNFVVGAEWFMSSRLSLMAEYSSEACFIYGHLKTFGLMEYHRGFVIQSKAVAFGICAYL